MKSPTRSDLERLLWSDPASECFEHDALEVYNAGDSPLNGAQMVLELVSVETGDLAEGMSLNGESAAADLRDLATTAKRAAIMLLHAGWAAEEAAERLSPKGRGQPC